MKKFVGLTTLAILMISMGCAKDNPGKTELELGREKLLSTSMTIEAIEHLQKSVQNRESKGEPRALLAVAYYHAISSGVAGSLGRESQYRNSAKQIVNQIGEAEIRYILEMISERHRVQKDAIKVLTDRGGSAVSILIDALNRDQFKSIHNEIREVIVAIGDVKPVIGALNSPNFSDELKQEFVQLIGEIGDPTSIDPLVAKRSNVSNVLRIEIDTALYRMGKKDFREAILIGLNSSSTDERIVAARALSVLNHSPTDQILQAIQDTSPEVRSLAINAIEKAPAEKGVELLLQVLFNDGDDVARQSAANALVAHAENGLAKGLAKNLITKLPKVESSKDQILIVSMLRSKRLKRQIKANPYDNLEYQLYQFAQKNGSTSMVKAELSRLLNDLETF